MYCYTKLKHRSREVSVAQALLDRLKLLLHLRKNAYDIVLLPNESDLARTIKLAKLIGARKIIGLNTNKSFSAKLDVAITPNGFHAVEAASSLMQYFKDTSLPPAVIVRPNMQAQAVATQCIAISPEQKLIALHISARKPRQRWPAQRYIELVQQLNQRDSSLRFLLLWSPGAADNPLHPGDDEKAVEIIKSTEGRGVIPYSTRQLGELIGALSICKGMICSDGGAMHLAAGLGLPIVCLFGNSSVARWHPWGVRYVALQKMSGDVADVTVAEVLHAFNDLNI